MLIFILEGIVVSILVSSFAAWIKLIPRYPKVKYSFLQQLINAGMMTILLTLFLSFEFYPSWLVLFLIILGVLWLSVLITNKIVPKGNESTDDSE